MRHVLLPPLRVIEGSHPHWWKQLVRAEPLASTVPGLHGAMPARLPYARYLSGRDDTLIADIVSVKADGASARTMALGVDRLDAQLSERIETTLRPWLTSDMRIEPVQPGRWILSMPGEQFHGLQAIDPDGLLGSQLTALLPSHRRLAQWMNEIQMVLSIESTLAPWNLLWCWGEATIEATTFSDVASNDPLLRSIPISADGAWQLCDWRTERPAQPKLAPGIYRSIDGQGWQLRRRWWQLPWSG